MTWFRQQYIRWKDEIQTRRSSSFRGKIEMYELDEVQRAIYGGSQGLDFEELCEQGVTVLVDFRHVLDEERLRWGMNIVFDRFLAFIRHRGLRQRLIHLCIDELSRMTNQDAQTGTDLFSQLLDTLLNVEARNRGVAVTLMIQGLWQVSEKLQATLLSCGNLMIGYQSDEESARKLAKHLFPYTGQPQVKRWEPVYAGSSEGPIQIDWRVVEAMRNAAIAARKADRARRRE